MSQPRACAVAVLALLDFSLVRGVCGGVESTSLTEVNLGVSLIDTELIESAAVLTAIGMGTAFALLVGLLVLVLVMTKSIELGSRFEWPFSKARAERDARDRAIAATAAVGALLAKRDAEEGE